MSEFRFPVGTIVLCNLDAMDGNPAESLHTIIREELV